ncbi:DUF3375 domain-containing protein [Stratiformator vulcanicus]|uniref:DUF3375 domain-containing protein n=1 Tax=Stratiformator vulcanicus TaxID=2527980 RepID=A0A517QXD7_9PLAN|nr:DUF3375 domain-containing protein [Stratiformator vulcanicus]QDT36274.1 hypothetical protein Pan189_06300 [Stratiformator vulcanicus]
MNLRKLKIYFDTSPALGLLRARSAPYVIDFLNRQFKQPGQIAIPRSELLSNLSLYLDDIRDADPDAMGNSAEAYLREWCSSDARWLRRFIEADRDEEVFQLTPYTEDVFAFLDQVLERDLDFVATESRLKMIIETLADLVVGASDDPKKRLAHLKAERDRLQEEIEQIERDGRISKYRPAQIRERFSNAVLLLRQLQGDFRAVEDSFREITTQVLQRQRQGADSRGEILEFALDHEDLLKQEDQGVSFDEFVKLILSPKQTQRLEEIVREVRQIPELSKQREGLEAVRNMITVLQVEAEKVMRTNQNLSATLRRLLDARAFAERKRVSGLLDDIQSLATELRGRPEDETLGLSLDLTAGIESPFRRSFWVEPPRFESVDLSDFQPDDESRQDVFENFAALKHLDWNRLRDQIKHLLSVEDAPSLAELLELHPVSSGLVEVIGYLQIAAEDGHRIDTTDRQEIVVSADDPDATDYLVTVPRVTFVPPKRKRRRKPR